MKIFAVGWNYLYHYKEMNRSITNPSSLRASLDWDKLALRVLHTVITTR